MLLQNTHNRNNGIVYRLWQDNPHACALALMLLFSLVRLWIASSGQIDLAQDEAQYWDWSRRLQLSYYSKGPFIAWVIAFGTSIFGNTELGVRVGAVFGNLLVQGLLYYWLAFLLRRPLLGLVTILIANTTPLFIASGILMTTDNPLLVCWVLAFTCLTALTERPSSLLPYIGIAIALSCGILSKYTMLLFVPLAVIYLMVLKRQKLLDTPLLGRLIPWLAVGVVLGLLPILMWNIENDFASFRHVARLAGVAAAPGERLALIRFDRFPEYLASQAGLLLPWWLGCMLWFGWKLVRVVYAGWNKNELQITGSAERQSQRFCWLLVLGFWPLWLFFLVWSFHTRVYPNWSAMSYAAGLVIAAAGVLQLCGSSQIVCVACETIKAPWQRGIRLCALLSLFICVIIHGQHFVLQALPLPDHLNPTVRLKGWSDLGRRLEEIRQQMPDPDKVFFFSDAYDVTAALAFYAPGQPVTYCADFGRRLSQYDLWADPNGRDLESSIAAAKHALQEDPSSPRYGWSAVYVDRKPIRKKLRPELYDMFRRVGRPEQFDSVHQGHKGRSFGVLPLQEFTGKWPRESLGIY